MRMITAPAIRVRWGDAGCSASARMRYAVPRDATGVRDASARHLCKGGAQGMGCFHLLTSLWGARLAEGSALRTRASDAGWLHGNISKRAVDLVPRPRSAPLRSQISSSFVSSATPFLFFPFSKTCALGASKIP